MEMRILREDILKFYAFVTDREYEDVVREYKGKSKPR